MILKCKLESLAPHRYVGSCKEAIQLADRTSVVLLRCPLVHKIMQGGAPEVYFHQ